MAPFAIDAHSGTALGENRSSAASQGWRVLSMICRAWLPFQDAWNSRQLLCVQAAQMFHACRCMTSLQQLTPT